MAKNKKKSADETWSSEDYWKQPKFDPTEVGDPNELGIFTAVGAALSAWEELEDRLASMFDMFGTDRNMSVTNHSHQIGRHVFGMTESSSSRLKMLNVAASLYFAEAWESKLVRNPYRQLFSSVSHASHRRNEIAHGRVTRMELQRGHGEMKDSGAFLTAPRYAVNRSQPFYSGSWHPDDVLGLDRSSYRYRMNDIVRFIEKFRVLQGKVIDLQMDASRGELHTPNIVLKLIREGKYGPMADHT